VRIAFDGHDSLTLTSVSLLFLYDNVLYMRSLFLLLNTFYSAWSRLVTFCHELLYILGFFLNTVCFYLYTVLFMEPNTILVSHVR
jgi:hypothetical protein